MEESGTKSKKLFRVNFELDFLSISLFLFGLSTRMYNLSEPKNVVYVVIFVRIYFRYAVFFLGLTNYIMENMFLYMQKTHFSLIHIHLWANS